VAGLIFYSGTEKIPAASVRVALWIGPRGSADLVGETQADSWGRFSFEGVGPGEHSFSTWSGEGEGWEYGHKPVTVEGGKTAETELRVERPLPPEALIPVKGTVKYDDGRAVGTFQFRLRSDNGVHVVAGKDGEFECILRRAGEYRVYDVEADGERREDRVPTIQVARGEKVAIVLAVQREVVLVVVDRATGAPLPSARAYRHQWEEDDFVYDDFPNARSRDGTPVPADVKGGIPLGRITGSETWFVVADGHAWEKVATAKGPAETRVALEPGGTVHLSVAGWAALADARVSAKFHGPRRRWTLPNPGPDGEAVYEGIAGGTWKFTVRRGWDFLRGEVYGEGSVEVLPGQESRLVIQTKPSAAGAPVPVSGTVTVPASWGLRRTVLSFDGADPTNSSVRKVVRLDLPADGSPVPYRLDPVPPGQYDVRVHPQWYSFVTVPPTGGSFDFRLPGPGTVLVRVVDDATEAPIDQAQVLWHTEAGRRGYGLETAKRTDAAGEFLVVAPAGLVALSASARGYAKEYVGGLQGILSGRDAVRPLDVREGIESKVTIRLRRAGTVHVVFKPEGEAPVWKDTMVEIHAEREGSRGWGVGVNIKDGQGTSDGLEAGPYKIQAGFLKEEYEPVKDIPVEVRAGETTEVVVPLVRKK
jgi:hypothetical protein